MATDALADLVNSGGSPENEQWQDSKGGNFKLDEDVTNDYRFPRIEVWWSFTSVDCFALISYL